MKKNPRRKAALLAVVLLVAAAGIILAVYIITGGAGSEPRAEKVTVPAPSASAESVRSRLEAASSFKQIPSASAPGIEVFKTNEDIRQKYGRVETVHLIDGRTFTGAVISSTAAEYSIVTVGGVKKVPMRNVKMRVIIR